LPSYVSVADLRVGLPVEYLGDANPDVVLSEPLRAVGLVLYYGHPGRVWSTTLQHVQVSWVGLADEPATYAVGFSLPSERTEQMHPGSDSEYGCEESWLGYVPLVNPDPVRASPQDAFYLGLGLLTEDEFGRREHAIHDSLMSGQSLSGSVPPWRTGD
jgi:hypothetical protein